MRVTLSGVLMPPKRGKNGGSPAKTPTSSSTKRVLRDETTVTQDAYVKTPAASTEVASSTDHDGSPHTSGVKDEPELMVDYNESTPLTSPMDDKDSERLRHENGSVIPLPMHRPLM